MRKMPDFSKVSKVYSVSRSLNMVSLLGVACNDTRPNGRIGCKFPWIGYGEGFCYRKQTILFEGKAKGVRP